MHTAGVRPERHRGLLRLSHNLLQETFCPVLNPVLSKIKSLLFLLEIRAYFKKLLLQDMNKNDALSSDIVGFTSMAAQSSPMQVQIS